MHNVQDEDVTRKRKLGSPATLFSVDGEDGGMEQFDEDILPAKEEIVTTKRKCLVKPPEPRLPDPFPLPQNFRPDVELALRAGKMTTDTRRAYMSQVASAIFGYKRYPLREEFMRVAGEIVKKYHFLESTMTGGSKTVSIVIQVYLNALFLLILF